MLWSFWEKDSFIKTPDVTIIGSGIVGLNAALNLKMARPELHVVVLERGVLPYGASTRNAGFACFGSVSELVSDLNHHSEEEVFNLVERRWKGLQKLRSLIGDTNLVYEGFGGYEIFTPADKKLFEECADKIPFFNKAFSHITCTSETYKISSEKIKSFGFGNVSDMIENTEEGQIDTGRMMKALLSKCRDAEIEILNGIDIDTFEKENNGVTIISKNGGRIFSKNLIIATNGFAQQLLPGIDVQPARAQVLITKPVNGLLFKGSFHYDHGYYYFRNVGDRVLFGGARNSDFENEFTSEFGETEKIQNILDRLLKDMLLPSTSFEVEMRWSGIMGLGPQKTPIVKKVSEHIYCSVRMGGMGIAIGSLVGKEVADLVIDSIP